MSNNHVPYLRTQLIYTIFLHLNYQKIFILSMLLNGTINVMYSYPWDVIIIDYAYYKYEVQLHFYVNIIKKTAPVGAKCNLGKK